MTYCMSFIIILTILNQAIFIFDVSLTKLKNISICVSGESSVFRQSKSQCKRFLQVSSMSELLVH